MPPEAGRLRVEVCHALPDAATRVVVDVAAGSTVADAVASSGVPARLALDADALSYAIFGRRATPATLVADGDRIELLRPLIVDPKEARRRRALKKGGAARRDAAASPVDAT